MLMTAIREGETTMATPRPIRTRPDDFEVVFVEQGRVECEAWYRCRRTTVDRWLEEAGKDRLIAKRAAFVKHLRDRKRAPEPVRRNPGQVARDRRRISYALARRAAEFLRSVRNGGWVVAPVSESEWLVGTRRRSAAELLDLAVRHGFDRRAANLQLVAEAREN